MRSTILVALCLTAQVAAGCSDPTGSRESPFVETPTPRSATPIRVIDAGGSVTGKIKPGDSTCTYFSVDEGWGGLCNVFLITPPEDGTLMTSVTWHADAPLVLFAKYGDKGQIDLACCGSPVEMQLPVEKGVTYRLEVAYSGRPAGYPNITPVEFVLSTALRTSDAQFAQTVNAFEGFTAITRRSVSGNTRLHFFMEGK